MSGAGAVPASQGVLLSIVIPVLDGARDLPDCLASVRAASMPRSMYEIVVADGGSSDDTVDVARRAGARVVHNPHRLAEPGARLAIEAAVGQFVMVLAVDNRIVSGEFLERALRAFRDADVDVVVPIVRGPAGDTVWNKYINRFSDPMTHFVYGVRVSPQSMIRGHSAGKDGSVRLRASRPTGLPLVALAQGTMVRRSRLAGCTNSVADDVTPLVGMWRHGGAMVVLVDAYVGHAHVGSLRDVYRKYRHRALANLTTKQGIRVRGPYLSPGQRLRTVLWVPYSASVILPVLNSWLMLVREQTPLALLHPVINTVVLGAVGASLVERVTMRSALVRRAVDRPSTRS